MGNKKIVVGVTGASGVILAYYLLKASNRQDSYEVHLIVTESAKVTWSLETNIPLSELYSLAHFTHDENNLAAIISSGSIFTEGMIVIPCSMKSLAGIASGYSDNLLLRAVDVSLKENRKVVLVPRESPLGSIHLRNLKIASENGCTIVPPMLTFYQPDHSIESQIEHIIGKILMQFGIKHDKFNAWEGIVL